MKNNYSFFTPALILVLLLMVGHIKTNAQVPEDLYLIGNASPAAWNIGRAIKMDQNESNDSIFSLDVKLLEGSFKIGKARNFCAEFLHPLNADEPIGSTNFEVFAGCSGNPDNQWIVSSEEKGFYTITVDFRDSTLTVSENAELPGYPHLFLVGDATPGGWDLNSSTELISDTANKAISGVMVSLTGGASLKIASYLDFGNGYEWVMPQSDGDSAFGEQFYRIVTSPELDFKWIPTITADYLVTVNQDLASITFQPQINNDATLLSLSTNIGTLEPAFDTSISTYTLSVPVGIDDIEVFAKPTNVNAKVTGDGIYSIIAEKDTINVVVTAEDDITEKTYSIIVTSKKLPGELYLIGDATPAHWVIERAIPLEQNTEDELVFTQAISLTAGQFKIGSAKKFCDVKYLHPLGEDTTIRSEKFSILTGCDETNPDRKWTVATDEEGTYLITVDFNDSSIAIVKDETLPSYTHLYLVGSATLAGWDLGQAIELISEKGQSSVFSVSTPLSAGDNTFKVATHLDFADGYEWIMPQNNLDDALGEQTYQVIIAGGEDLQWAPTDSALYHIKINLADSSITMQPQLKNDARLLGLSSSLGNLEPSFDWDQLTYNVTLPKGTESINLDAKAMNLNATISDTGLIDLSEGSKEVDIIVTAADEITTKTYSISINVGSVVGIQNENVQLQPQLQRNISSNELNMLHIDQFYYAIFSLTGKLIEQNKSSKQSIQIQHLSSGLYFLKITTSENKHYTFKFIKQ